MNLNLPVPSVLFPARPMAAKNSCTFLLFPVPGFVALNTTLKYFGARLSFVPPKDGIFVTNAA